MEKDLCHEGKYLDITALGEVLLELVARRRLLSQDARNPFIIRLSCAAENIRRVDLSAKQSK
jgi:hypothetical protein